MSRAFVCLVAIALSASSVLSAGARSAKVELAQAPARDIPAPPGTATIRGRVLAADANEHPLSRVEVRATCTPLRINRAVLTDAGGRYEIGELPAGRYTVSFSRANYVRATYGQRRPLGPGAAIEIANGQIVSRVDAVLLRGGVIAGRILDELGDPMTGAQVMPMRWAFVNGERRLQLSGSSATANDLGKYRLFGIVPGQYFISATLQNAVSGDTTDRASYAPTYYPGTGNPAEAQRLTVLSGQTITGINLTLMPVVASRISGVALTGQGRPMANVFLTHRAGMLFAGNAPVRPDGTFTLAGVPPGDYRLLASASVPGVSDETATADVTVSGGDVTGVQLVGVKASTLRGRVVFEPGDVKPPAVSAVRIFLIASAPAISGGGGNPQDDATFEIKAGAGRAHVRATVLGTGDWSLKRVLTRDGIDVIDAGLDVPVNATVEGLVVEMTSRHNDLSGTVVDAAGARVRDCVVVVFAQDAQRWAAQTRYFGTTRPDQESVFHMRLPAGDYYVAAFEDPDTSVPLNDPEILQQLRDRAVKFSLGDGETQKLDVPLGQPPVY